MLGIVGSKVWPVSNFAQQHETTSKRVWKRSKHVTSTGADPGFFLGGGALVSCSTSTPINHIVFFFFRRIPVVLENRRSSQGGGVRTPCILPLDPPLFQQCSVRLHVTQTTLSHLFLAVAHAKSITLSEFASRLTPTRIGKRSVKESFSTKGAQTYGRNYDERGGNIRKELQIICKWK